MSDQSGNDVTATERRMVQLIDAAMVAAGDLDPPLRRSDCARIVAAVVAEAYSAHCSNPTPGWILAPEEANEVMKCAGFQSDAWRRLGQAVIRRQTWPPYSCRERAECVAGIYRQMIKAARHTAPAPGYAGGFESTERTPT